MFSTVDGGGGVAAAAVAGIANGFENWILRWKTMV